MKQTHFKYFLILFLFFLSSQVIGSILQDNNEPENHPAALFLSNYLKVPSVTGSEKAAGEFLAQACHDHGLHVYVFTDEIDSYNFAASLYPLELEKPNIVFLTHIDVVPEGDEALWTYHPYSGAIANGHVWGRGAIDNKGHGVMQFFALVSFVQEAKQREMPYNFTLLAVSNEETDGSLGAGVITNLFLDQLNPVAVYGEGGIGMAGLVKAQPDLLMFGIETAQKKALWFKIESNGSETGHGSVPIPLYPASEITKAANAVLSGKNKIKLLPVVEEMLNNIGEEETGLRKLVLKNFRVLSPLVGNQVRKEEMMNALLTNTVTLTNLGGGGGAYNQMAQDAWATFDARLLPGTSSESFLSGIRKKIAAYDVELVVIKDFPHAPVSPKGRFFKALEKAVLDVFREARVTPILFPAVNDNFYFRQKGVPTYGLVPCVLTTDHLLSIHNIDERIPIKALEEGIAVYQSLIRTLSISLLAKD